MYYLLCKHQVADYPKWRAIFDSHAKAQEDAGLHLLHVLRDIHDPNLVVMFFKIDSPDQARAFTEAPEASQAASDSGVIGRAEVLILSE